MKTSRPMVMMMTMIDRHKTVYFLILLLLAGAGNAVAQQKDFQSWYELELNKDLKNGIDLSLEAEQRFENNSMQYDRSLLTLSADYDLLDFLNAELGVRGLVRMNRERHIQPQYRLHADATLEQSVAQFDFSLRSRLQFGFDELNVLRDAGDNKLVNRNKLQAQYDIFGTRIEVSAYVESYHKLNSSAIRSFYRMRYSARIEYTLGFRSALNLKYILEDEFNVTDPLQAHILVAGFSYDL